MQRKACFCSFCTSIFVSSCDPYRDHNAFKALFPFHMMEPASVTIRTDSFVGLSVQLTKLMGDYDH